MTALSGSRGNCRVHLSPGAFVLPIGGVRRTAFEMLHGLQRAGADVRIAGWITDAPTEVTRPFGVARRTLLQMGDAIGHLSRLAQRRRSVTHALYYDLSAVLSGSPVVVTAYDMIHERFDVGGRLLPLAKRAAIKRADAVVCISQATADDVQEHFPKARNLRVIHLGVDNRTLTDAPQPGTRRHLLFVGQRGSYKNADVMFEAIERNADLRSLPLVLVGGGPLTKRERERLARLSVLVEHRINLDESELIDLYDLALALVVPSRVEGFGLPVVEAMARGCPVACASAPSLIEVSGGHAAAVFAPDDPESCADAICRAIAASDEAVRAAQQHARGFTWERTVRQHLDLYNDLVR